MGHPLRWEEVSAMRRLLRGCSIPDDDRLQARRHARAPLTAEPYVSGGGVNLSQAAEPRMSPRTKGKPPSASGGTCTRSGCSGDRPAERGGGSPYSSRDPRPSPTSDPSELILL